MDFESIEDPLDVVEEWRFLAEEAGQPQPDAMVLATVDVAGTPHARVVLFKGRKDRQIWFFTNYQSDKAAQLTHCPRAEVCIFHPALALQARLAGTVQKLSEQQSEDYFSSRPRESQLGAWASRQSAPLSSRAQLDRAVAEVERRYAGQPVPRPPHWGGYGLVVDSVELWLGQAGRLHDRARYVFEDQVWRCTRLFP
jgi:pyridoxamine 5'-phosphate oxidase